MYYVDGSDGRLNHYREGCQVRKKIAPFFSLDRLKFEMLHLQIFLTEEKCNWISRHLQVMPLVRQEIQIP